MSHIEQLDPTARDALADATTLLLIAREVKGMNETFRNAPDLDAGHAMTDARRVMEICRDAGVDVFRAAFSTDASPLRKARALHIRLLQEAVQSAERLASDEYAAIPENSGRGVFELRVQGPLKLLVEQWSK